MKGWRKNLIGEKLVRLLEGKLSMRLVDGELAIESI